MTAQPTERSAPSSETEVTPMSEGTLAEIARHLNVGLVLYSPSGEIEWANDGFIQMTGYPLAELQGQRREEFIHGPSRGSDPFQRLSNCLRDGTAEVVELVTRSKQGRPYWAYIDVKPLKEGDRITGILGMERDITARRQSEERGKLALRKAESLTQALRLEKNLLTAILGTIPYFVWWKNTDLRFIACNPAYLEMRSIGTEAELVGQREDQLAVTDQFGYKLVPLEQNVLDTGNRLVDHQVIYPDVSGRPRTVMVSLLPHVEAGELGGVIGIGADISQLTEMERQLNTANRLESIGQLAAGVAHEINTPIQYVADNTRFVSESVNSLLRELESLNTYIVEETEDGGALAARLNDLDLPFLREEMPSALTQSLEGLERVAQIVRALKDFSHPGEGLVETPLNPIVDATIQISRSEWKYCADVTSELSPDDRAVPCFEGELKQVLLNLVVNAAHAIEERRKDEPNHQGQIKVSTQFTADEAQISIQDNGNGIPPEIRERVFDPFFTTKDVGQGTGQGLALAQASIVGRHGGRLELDSTIGKGTTFTVVLPLVHPREHSSE